MGSDIPTPTSTCLSTVGNRQLARRAPVSGSEGFPVASDDLVGLSKRGQRIGHGHLAGLVALQAHLLQNLAAGEAITRADHFQQLVAFGAAARFGNAAGTGLSTWPCRFALEHVELAQHLV